MLLTEQELNGGKEENPEDSEAKVNIALQDTRTDLCERCRCEAQLCCENRFLFVHKRNGLGLHSVVQSQRGEVNQSYLTNEQTIKQCSLEEPSVGKHVG